MGDVLSETDVREYGLDDGLRYGGAKRYQSVVTDSQGHVWFSTNRGLSVVDPARASQSRPALVHIELADGSPFDLRGPIRFRLKSRGLRFDSLIELTNPQRPIPLQPEGLIRLEEPVATREASYANLGPIIQIPRHGL
jgi:hypothetical protein